MALNRHAAVITALILIGAVAAPAERTAGAAPAPTKVVSVSSVAALQSAVKQAQPGDRIELADGSYSTSSAIALTRSGTASAPITIAAQHTGKAEIKGTDGFSFGSIHYVTVEGFRLTHGSAISLPTGADHVRLTRNVIQLSNSATKNWVTVACDDCQVDHNTFQHKSSLGVFLQISGPGSSGMAERVWIHHNYFYDHSYSGSNGGESIRLGLSSRQHAAAHATVEYNLFEKANGDSEAISVKSSDNIVRYNTLRNSRGQICLRHGSWTLVEGNIILGGTSGIRFFGNDHVIINNLIQNIGGMPIEVGAGNIRDDTNSTTDHEAADRGLVAFNTVVSTKTNLIGIGTEDHQYKPDHTTVADNVLVGGSGNLVTVDGATNTKWEGNIVWGGSRGDMPADGGRSVNPALVVDSGGLDRLAAGSPAIDTATGSYSQVTQDMDLQARSGAKDVGADEYVAGGTQRRALTTADVGPSAP
ncbi:polysaccharide lyase 6 family protein [Actinoallomurus sp. CA-150999]|uniref:polysaccharide lyase 6 family protein n=1 Tax=Actinoallomurus sp. CA-150999 TaxID=3239887 RepID=UPI003D8FF9D6